MKPISRWSFASFTEVLNHSLQHLLGTNWHRERWRKNAQNDLVILSYFVVKIWNCQFHIPRYSKQEATEPPFQICEASGSQLPSMRRGLARRLSRAWPGHLQMIPNRVPLQGKAEETLRHKQNYPPWVFTVNLNPRWNSACYSICLRILKSTAKRFAVLMASEASFRVTWPPELLNYAYVVSACQESSTAHGTPSRV